MKKILEYTKNVASSVGFAVNDIVKNEAPASHDFIDKNSELFKNIAYDIKNHKQLFNRLSSRMKSHNMYKVTGEIKKSIFEDFKSGKLYNKKRDDLYSAKALGMDDLGGYESPDSDSSDDLDFDKMFDLDNDIDNTSSESIKSKPSQGDHMISDTVINTGLTNANAITKALVSTTEFQIENSRAQYKDKMLRDYKTLGILNNSLGNINSQLNHFSKDGLDILSTHAKNSKSYYETTVNYQKDMMGMMTEFMNMQRELYKSKNNESSKKDKKNNNKIYYDDVIQASGIVDINQYIKAVSKNIKSQLSSITQFGDMFKDEDNNNNPYIGLAGSPLKMIPQIIAKKLTGKELMRAMGNFDKTISNSFSSSMALLNSIKNDENSNKIQQIIAKSLVPRIKSIENPNPANYNKNDMSWNGKGQKAITEVIPMLLAKQLSVMTGTDEKIYDYDRGIFIKGSSIKSEFDNIKKSHINNTFYELKEEITSRIDKMILMDYEEQKNFKNDMNTFFKYFFNKGSLINPKLKMDKYTDLDISKNNYDLITAMLRNIDKHKLMSVNTEMFNNKHQLSNRINNSKDIYKNLFNNSNINEFLNIKKDYSGIKKIIGSNVNNGLNTKDEYNNTIFNYLKSIRDILIEGINIFPGYNNGSININKEDIGDVDRKKLLNQKKVNLSFKDNNTKNRLKAQEIIKNKNDDIIKRYNKNKAKKVKDNLKYVNYSDVIADDKINFYQATFNQNQILNRKRQERLDNEWDREHESAIDTISRLMKDENATDNKLEKRQLMEEINKKAVERANEKDKKLFPWQKKNDEENKNRRPSFIDGFLSADGGSEKLAYTSDQLFKFINKPNKSITKMLNKVDKRIYELFYGGEDVMYKGEHVRGYMDMLILNLDRLFFDVREKINKHFLTPLREKLNELGIFDKLKDWKNSLKEKADSLMTTLFGEKDKKGWRHGGFFGNTLNQIKGDTKGLFKTIFKTKDKSDDIEMDNYVNEINEGMTDNFTKVAKRPPKEIYSSNKSRIDYLNNQSKLIKDKIEIINRNERFSKKVNEYNKKIENAKSPEEKQRLIKNRDRFKSKIIDIPEDNFSSSENELWENLKNNNHERNSLLKQNKMLKSKIYTPRSYEANEKYLNGSLDKEINRLKELSLNNNEPLKKKENSNSKYNSNFGFTPNIVYKTILANFKDNIRLLKSIRDGIYGNNLDFKSTDINSISLNSEEKTNIVDSSNKSNYHNDYNFLSNLFDEADKKNKASNEKEMEILTSMLEKNNSKEINIVRDKWKNILTKRGIDVSNINFKKIITSKNYDKPYEIPEIRKLLDENKFTHAYKGALINSNNKDIDFDYIPTNLYNNKEINSIMKNIPFINNTDGNTKNKLKNQLSGAESIPAFAEGGAVVNGPTIASLGENGSELVIPLKKMRYLQGTKKMFTGLLNVVSEMKKEKKITKDQYNRIVSDLWTAETNMDKKVSGRNAKKFNYNNEYIKSLMMDSFGVNNKPYDNEFENRNLYNIKTNLVNNAYRDMDFDNLDDLKSKKKKKWFEKGLDKIHSFSKDNYENGLMHEVKTEVLNSTSSAMASLFGVEEGKEDEFKEKTKKMTMSVLKEIKGHSDEAISGAVIGAGAGLMPFTVFGPIFGAVLGSAASIISRSESLQNKIFGTKNINGKRQDDGLLPAEIVNKFNKYAPDTLRLGLGGSLLSILPFVPGGPLTGLLAGSAIAFAKNNESAQKFLFGDNLDDNGLIKKSTKEKFKKTLPKTIGGAGLGAISSLITPFGLVGSTLIGGTLGALSTNDTVKQLLFGEYKPGSNKRVGGLIPTVRDAITSPIKKLLMKSKGSFHNFLIKNIKKPLLYAITPLGKEMKLIGKKIGDHIKKLFDETIGSPLKRLVNKLLFKPLGFLLKKFIGGGLTFGKYTIGLPLTMISKLGKSLRGKHIRQGNADYMTSEERNIFRRKNRKLFRSKINPLKGRVYKKDIFKNRDKAIELLNELSEDEYYQLMDEIKQAKRDRANGKDPRFSSTKFESLAKILNEDFNKSDIEINAAKVKENIKKDYRVFHKDEYEKSKKDLLNKINKKRDKKQEKINNIKNSDKLNSLLIQRKQLELFMKSKEYLKLSGYAKATYEIKYDKIVDKIDKIEYNIYKKQEILNNSFSKKWNNKHDKLIEKEEIYQEKILKKKNKGNRKYDNSYANRALNYTEREISELAKNKGWDYKKYLKDKNKSPDEKILDTNQKGNEIAEEQLEVLKDIAKVSINNNNEEIVKKYSNNISSTNKTIENNKVVEEINKNNRKKLNKKLVNKLKTEKNKETSDLDIGEGILNKKTGILTKFMEDGTPIRYDKDESGEWRPLKTSKFKKWLNERKLNKLNKKGKEVSFLTKTKENIKHKVGFFSKTLSGIGGIIKKVLLGTVIAKYAKDIWTGWLSKTEFGKNLIYNIKHPSEVWGKISKCLSDVWDKRIQPFIENKLPSILNWIKEAIGSVAKSAISAIPKAVGTIVPTLWNNKELLLYGAGIALARHPIRHGKKIFKAGKWGFNKIKNKVGKKAGEKVAEKIFKKEGKNVSETILNKESKNVAETILNKESKNVAETILNKESKNVAEKVVKNGRKYTIKRGMNTTVKTEGKNVAETILKKEGKSVAEKIVKKEGKSVAEKVVKKEGSVILKKFKKIVGKMSDTVCKIIKKHFKSININGIKNIIKKALDKLLHLKKGKFLSKIMGKIIAKMSKDIVKTVGWFLTIGFMVYGAISGVSKSETARLFGIEEENINGTMRLVSSCIRTILEIPSIWVLDILDLVTTHLTGQSILQQIAIGIYEAITNKCVNDTNSINDNIDQYSGMGSTLKPNKKADDLYKDDPWASQLRTWARQKNREDAKYYNKKPENNKLKIIDGDNSIFKRDDMAFNFDTNSIKENSPSGTGFGINKFSKKNNNKLKYLNRHNPNFRYTSNFGKGGNEPFDSKKIIKQLNDLYNNHKFIDFETLTNLSNEAVRHDGDIGYTMDLSKYMPKSYTGSDTDKKNYDIAIKENNNKFKNNKINENIYKNNIKEIEYQYKKYLKNDFKSEDERKLSQTSYGINYGNKMSTINNFPYWSQYDNRWKDEMYVDNNKFGDVGCAPTSMAMIASAFNKVPITPKDLFSMGKKFWHYPEGGTNGSIFNSNTNRELDKLNIKGKDITTNWSNLITNLKNNKPVVLLGKADRETTPYTNAGHYGVATGITPDNKILVNDPISPNESVAFDKEALFNKVGPKNTIKMWAFTDKDGNSLANTNNNGDIDITNLNEYKDMGFFEKLTNGINNIKGTVMDILTNQPYNSNSISNSSNITNNLSSYNTNSIEDELLDKYNGIFKGDYYYKIISDIVNTEKVDKLPNKKINGDYLRDNFFTGSYNTPLKDHADALIKSAYKYNVNPLILASIIGTESGWGRSALARDKNNYSGYCAYDSDPYNKAKTFSSPEECFSETARLLHDNYITPGSKFYDDGSLLDVNQHYSSSLNWSKTISSIIASRIKNMDNNAQLYKSSQSRINTYGKGIENNNISNKKQQLNNSNNISNNSSITKIINILNKIVGTLNNIDINTKLLTMVVELLKKESNLNITKKDLIDLKKSLNNNNGNILSIVGGDNTNNNDNNNIKNLLDILTPLTT